MTYKEFIESIKQARPLNEWFEHSERHHIMPRCLGGTDDEDNLIYLTYREHFIAHKLLAEENPENNDLVKTVFMMSNFNKQCTPEEYEIIRSNACKAISKSLKGKVRSEDHCRNISLAHKGMSCYWSDEAKIRNRERRANNPNKYNLICKRCGLTFIANGPTKKYCVVCENKNLPDRYNIDIERDKIKAENYSKANSKKFRWERYPDKLYYGYKSLYKDFSILYPEVSIKSLERLINYKYLSNKTKDKYPDLINETFIRL